MIKDIKVSAQKRHKAAAFVLYFLFCCPDVLVHAQLKQDHREYSGLNGKRETFAVVVRELRSVGDQKVEDSSHQATLSLAELRIGMAESIASIHSMEIKYRYDTLRHFATAGQRAIEKEGRLVPRNFSLRVHGAFLGEKQFIDSEEVTDGKALRHTISAFNGGLNTSFQPNVNQGSIIRERGADTLVVLYDYCGPNSIPVGSGDDVASFKQSVSFLPYATSFEEIYSVQPNLEIVDGSQCHVVTSGIHTIWIDADSGYRPRRQVLFSIEEKDGPLYLDVMACCTDFRSLTDNIKLPWQVDGYSFGGTTELPENRGKIANERHLRLDSLRVNEIQDDVFELQLPPGARVIDRVRDLVYFVPSSADGIEKAVAEGAKILEDGRIDARRSTVFGPNLGSLDLQNGQKNDGRMWRSLLVMVNVALVILLLVFGVQKRRVKSKK